MTDETVHIRFKIIASCHHFTSSCTVIPSTSVIVHLTFDPLGIIFTFHTSTLSPWCVFSLVNISTIRWAVVIMWTKFIGVVLDVYFSINFIVHYSALKLFLFTLMLRFFPVILLAQVKPVYSQMLQYAQFNCYASPIVRWCVTNCVLWRTSVIN